MFTYEKKKKIKSFQITYIRIFLLIFSRDTVKSLQGNLLSWIPKVSPTHSLIKNTYGLIREGTTANIHIILRRRGSRGVADRGTLENVSNKELKLQLIQHTVSAKIYTKKNCDKELHTLYIWPSKITKLVFLGLCLIRLQSAE